MKSGFQRLLRPKSPIDGARSPADPSTGSGHRFSGGRTRQAQYPD